MNVRRSEVSGRGEVPGVGANLDGEGSGVTKVENYGLRGVHPLARLDLPVLYGRYRFADGPEKCLQFVLGGGWADYLGVFSASGVLAIHPCSLGFLRATSSLLYANTPAGRKKPSSRHWRRIRGPGIERLEPRPAYHAGRGK